MLHQIPNIISFMRIALAPAFVYLFATDQFMAATMVVVVAAFSDWIDGMMARRLGWVSKFGEILDVVADKVFVTAVLAVFVWRLGLPLWEIGIVYSRDLFILLGMIGIYFVYRIENLRLKSLIFGKITTSAQYVFILAVMFGLPRGLLIPAIALIGVASIVQYVLYLRSHQFGELVRK